MKKIIVPILSCVLVGFLFCNIMFNQYEKDEILNTSSDAISEKVYFIQVGVYSSLENMKTAMEKTSNYIYQKENDKYNVYVGMTKEKENIEKLKGYFERKSYNIYIKEITVTNRAFLDMLAQYDLLLKEATSDESISTVQKSVLAKYEELLGNENKGNTD